MHIVQEIQRKFNCKRLYIDKMSFLFEGKTKKKKKTCNKIRTLFFRFLFLTPFMAALTSEKHPQVMFRTI